MIPPHTAKSPSDAGDPSGSFLPTLADSEGDFHTGSIALCGRPNVGKSTLLNTLVGSRLSITSSKAQTTRHRINGVLTKGNAQYIFVDTPGYQTRYRGALHRSMNRAVQNALASVDVVLFVIEASRFGPDDQAVQALLPESVPVILVINKADLLNDKNRLLPFIEQRAAEYDYAAIVPVSAESGLQIDILLATIARHLPVGAPIFEADDLTDRNERFLAAERVREKVFRLLGDELPYGMTVQIDRFETQADPGQDAQRRIYATILVERDAHKAMLIGKGGEKLKRIGSDARRDMEALFGGKIYLELWVKVKSGWADDEAALKGYGYE